jgi:hypothetical protein
MAWKEKILNQLITNTSQGEVYPQISGRIVSVAITCQSRSDNSLFIGWNESASGGSDYLDPGQSYAIVAQQGNILDGNKLSLLFDTTNPIVNGNFALIKIKYLSEEIEEC